MSPQPLFDTVTTDVFPVNVITLIATRFRDLWSDVAVVERMLVRNDPSQSVGIYPVTRGEDQNSYELKGNVLGGNKASLSRYKLGIQAFIRADTPEGGSQQHAVLAKAIENVLYNDAPLNVGLESLAVTENNKVERILRHGVGATRYLSGELQAKLVYLSNTEYWLDTQNE
jgi:hypothetical protein